MQNEWWAMTPTSGPEPNKPLLRSVLRLLILRRSNLWSLPGSPRALALLWLGTTLAAALLGLIDAAPFYYAGAQFGVSAAMAFAAIAVTAILRGRGDPLRLTFGFIAIGAAATLVRTLVGHMSMGQDNLGAWADVVVIAWSVAAACRLVLSAAGWAGTAARIAAYLVIAATFVTALEWDTIKSRAAPLFLGDEGDTSYPPIDAEALWTAQPRLLASEVKPLTDARQEGRSIYLLAFAPGGSQQLFGREAEAVLRELSDRYAGEGRPALFSNAREHLLVHPLANRTNLEGAIAAIRRSYEPSRDIVFIYLTSHGGPDGTLATDLPDYTSLAPLSAEFLANALDEAKIARRVVIVSACYSGTWIKPLSSPDTIVLTASAADRTSFGCDDSRKYTVFGQAVVDSALNRGVSLRGAFEEIQRRVASEEAVSGVQPSLPQVYVGERMSRLWDGSGARGGVDDIPNAKARAKSSD